MSLKLIDFIKSHHNWEKLLSSSPYNIKISRDGDYIIFKYNQIESDFSLDEVRESRGIIFNEKTWKCVCRPFIKFFNYGEPNAAEIDWRHIMVTEKIDGSLMKLWWDGEWHLSTNGTIDANKAIVNNVKDLTFADLFWQVFDISILSKIDKGSTHMFELVSPESRVVIPYENTELYYLASHENDTGYEWHSSFLSYKFKTPAVHYFFSVKEICDYCDKLDWMTEGFVVYDWKNRVKIKSPAYIKAHYARTNGAISWDNLVNIVLNNEKDEFLVYASDYTAQIKEIENRIHDMEVVADSLKYSLNKFFDLSRKDFAGKIKDIEFPYNSYLFKVYDNHNFDFRSFIAGMPLSRLVKILGLKN